MAAEEPVIAQECVEGYLFHRPPLRLLVFRRPPVRGRIWVPVSGKVEASDPDFEHALRRELVEETGISKPKAVFPLDWDVIFENEPGVRWRLHAFAVELDSELQPTLSAEHERFEWVTFDEAIRRLHYEDNRKAVDRLQVRLNSQDGRSPSTL